MAEQREQRVRQTPRMGLNALAQYMMAGAAARERILHDQKYPTGFRPIWYEHATRAIVRFLLASDRDAEMLTRAEDRIRALPYGGQNERQKLQDNADAVAAFSRCVRSIMLDGMTTSRGPEQANVFIEGVTISIRPEILLRGHYRGQELLGGLKVYLSKREPLQDEGLAIVGSLLHMAVDRLASEHERCIVRHCTVVDVFAGQCACAPTAVVRRRREVEATCREIAHRWPAV